MTNYIILAFCVIIILSYLFDISSKYSKIPGVILLIALGILIHILADRTGYKIPNLKPILPVIGTIGLILIVMEASLDLKLEKSKKKLIKKSVSSALILLVFFVIAFSYCLVQFFDFTLRDSLLNAIPLGIISSSIAIPSAAHLNPEDKEFIVYESSFSDIFGIILFDYILLNQTSIGLGILYFAIDGIVTLIIAVISTSILAILLHKITYHVNYVMIMTAVILIYVLAKLSHLPALLLVLIFGMVLINNQFLEIDFIKKYVDFGKFRNDISSFKRILGELTFIVRSFFFIMFGYYTNIYSLINLNNIIIGLAITLSIFLMRWLFFAQVLRLPARPLVFFAPRGLITILLFLSIPVASRIPLISEEVITLVIIMTIIILTWGNMMKRNASSEINIIQQSESQDPLVTK